MLSNDILNLIDVVVLRYQRLVRQHALLPARTDNELAERLAEVHQLQPLNFTALNRLDDLDLIIAVGDIDLHYCPYAHKMKDEFRSRYAL